MEEQKTEDYKERLQKVRQRRNGKDPMHWFMIGGCAVIVVLALVIIVIWHRAARSEVLETPGWHRHPRQRCRKP